MKKRRGVAAKVAATLVLALGGFTLAAVVSGVGFASGETTDSTPSTTDTTPTTTDTTPTTTAPPPEGEGCTPGFWKNLRMHGGFWTLDPNAPVSSVFSAATGAVGAQSLIAALENGGGGVDALLRHGVAAVLNARAAGLDFPFTEAEVVAAVNAALASNDPDLIEDTKNLLAGANEGGCPFGNDGDKDE
jgi:hypothetical protein